MAVGALLIADENQGVSETLEGSVSNAESVQIDSASLKGVFGEESESDKEEGSGNKYSRKSLVKSLSDGSLRESPQRREMLKRKSFNAEEGSQKMAKLEEEEENRRKRLKLNFDDERERKENCEIERKGKRIVKEEEEGKKIFGAPTSGIEEVKDKEHGREGPSEIEVRNENDGRESFSEIEELKDEHSRGGVSEIEEVGDENGGRGRVSEIEEEIEVRDEDNRRGGFSEIEEEEDGYHRRGGRGFSVVEEEDDIEEEEEGLRRRGRYRRGGGRVSEIEEDDEHDGRGIVSEIEEEDKHYRRFLSFRRVTEIEEVDEEKSNLSPSTRFSEDIKVSPIIEVHTTPKSPDYLEKREKAKFQTGRDLKKFWLNGKKGLNGSPIINTS
uniref:Uncharacterized protein n=1 Tax=Meloidogyne javanica TaxID=6303 RepID=A0A915MGX8_MELJA